MKKQILVSISIAALTAPFAWCVLSLTRADINLSRRVVKEPGDVVVVGNSVVDFASKCDQNKDGIPRFLAAKIEQPVADLSMGGHTFWEGLGYVNFRNKVKGIKKAVFIFGPGAYALSTLSSREQKSRNILFNGVFGGSWDPAEAGWRPNLPVNADQKSLSYKGVQYGDYRGIKKYFMKEESAWRCPESGVQNEAFFEFMHWRALQKMNPDDYDFGLIVSEYAKVKAKGIDVLVVLPPQPIVAFEATVGVNETNKLRLITKKLTDKLQQSQIPVMDLTLALQPEHFSQKWCACGHLTESGRRIVADSISSIIR